MFHDRQKFHMGEFQEIIRQFFSQFPVSGKAVIRVLPKKGLKVPDKSADPEYLFLWCFSYFCF